MSDDRPQLCVHMGMPTGDTVRTFYELPDELVRRIQTVVKADGPGDHMTVDQALEAFFDEFTRVLAAGRDLREGVQAAWDDFTKGLGE